MKDGDKRLSLAKDKELVLLLKALLSMPIEWDSYRGAVVVRTPIFYIVTTSTPYAERKVIQYNGDFIPKEAASGIRFPFNR